MRGEGPSGDVGRGGAGTASLRSIVALSSLVAVAFGTLFYAFSVLATEDAAGADFSTSVLSFAYGGTVLVGGLMAYVVGRTADRHGVRGIVALGSLLGAGGLWGISLATRPWQVVAAAWLLVGPAGAMTFYEPAFVAVDQWYGPRRRARALAILTVVGGLAGPVFLPATARLVEVFGWRPAARTLGGVLAVVGLTVASLVPGGGTPTAPFAERVRVGSLVRDRRFVLFSGSVVLGYLAMQAVFFHRIALFEASGFAVGSVAALAAVSGLLSFPGRWGAPFLASRFAPLRLNALALAVLGMAVGFMVVPDSTWQMALHFVLFGVAFGVMLPLRAVVMSTWYSGPGYGRIMGVQWTAGALAGAAGPAVVGLMRDRLGGYTVAAGAVAAVLFAAAFLALASGAGASSR